jgi:flavin-dependent dehydrogenase
MDSCDALIVGGGPAGSACATALKRGGLDVWVLDRARFPRDKLCAGWVTPQAVAAVELDLGHYRQGRVLQEVRGIRTSRIGGRALEARYDEVVSYGVRRCEFDHYLLSRSGARLQTASLDSLRGTPGGWIVNEAIRTPLVIGAGGHFCPVARVLGAGPGQRPLVAAQEIEVELSAEQQRLCRVRGDTPELFFCRDLEGYGWLFRKGDHLNVGFGRRQSRTFRSHLQGFARFLAGTGRVPPGLPERWPGHAYLLYEGPGRTVLAGGALLVGDAAGLAYPQSGEGIGPALESGRLAAQTILAARGRYGRADLEPYRRALEARFGPRRTQDVFRLVPGPLRAWLGGQLLSHPLTNRHLVLDRWFLRRSTPELPVDCRLSTVDVR